MQCLWFDDPSPVGTAIFLHLFILRRRVQFVMLVLSIHDFDSVLEGGISLQLSPADVSVAVRIVERLALQAPSALLSYTGNSTSRSAGTTGSRSVENWLSIPVPAFEDEAFGFAGDTLRVLRAAMAQHFGNHVSAAAGATASGATSAVANESARRGPCGSNVGVRGPDLYGHGSMHPGLGVRTAASAAMGAVGSKPSLCLVAGDALGARLLGWCTVACRSPQWRAVFLGGFASPGVPPLPLEPPSGGDDVVAVAGTKRTAQEMETSATKNAEEGPTRAVGHPDGDHERKSQTGDGVEATPGLAQLLCTVGQVIRAVKGHTWALATARDRASGAGFFPGTVGGTPSFDLPTRESSCMVQALVGALAEAILDVFADHMADQALHSQLGPGPHTALAAVAPTAVTPGVASRGCARAISDVAPLVDGASPAETVGLSVELLGDITWLFSALEPEAGEGGAGGACADNRSSAAKAGSAAALLSCAISCWISGRLLSCMPGREQLEYTLGLPCSTRGGSGNGAVEALQGGDLPAVRPLPAKLALFAVHTLLENVHGAREKGCEATEVLAALHAEEATAARACAGRPTAFYRVALIAEQMPAWRERRQQWHRRRLLSLDGSAADTEGGGGGWAATYNDEEVATAAAPAAAAEVLDAVLALLCAATEHERLSAVQREQAEASGARRRPTMYAVGSIGNLIGPALHAVSELLAPACSISSVSGGGSNQGSAASTRSALLTRAKKRRGSSPGGSGGGGSAASASGGASVVESHWTALAGLQLSSCLDQVHLAGMLLAWEPWHPWMEKVVPAAAATSTAGRTSVLSLKQSQSWQTFWLIASQLAQACVSPRPPPPPPGQGLAALVTHTVVSFRAARDSGGNPVPFLDMPAILLLGKVCVLADLYVMNVLLNCLMQAPSCWSCLFLRALRPFVVGSTDQSLSVVGLSE